MATTKFITDVLKEINDDPSLLKTTYRKVGNGGPLGQLFYHAFMPQGKFILPEGDPPFKKDPAPMGMSPAVFQAEIRKLAIFTRTDLSKNRRETLFIQLLESIHPDEAKILLAIKDQNLTKLYPKITRTVLADAGFLPPLTAEQLAAEQAKVKNSAGRVAAKKTSSKSARPQPTE